MLVVLLHVDLFVYSLLQSYPAAVVLPTTVVLISFRFNRLQFALFVHGQLRSFKFDSTVLTRYHPALNRCVHFTTLRSVAVFDLWRSLCSYALSLLRSSHFASLQFALFRTLGTTR